MELTAPSGHDWFVEQRALIGLTGGGSAASGRFTEPFADVRWSIDNPTCLSAPVPVLFPSIGALIVSSRTELA